MACSGNQGHRELVAGVVLLEAFLMRRMACSLDPIAGYGYGGAHLQEVFKGQAGFLFGGAFFDLFFLLENYKNGESL